MADTASLIVKNGSVWPLMAAVMRASHCVRTLVDPTVSGAFPYSYDKRVL
jgi:hypothetical protein